MEALARSGDPIDYAVVDEGFRSFVEDTYGRQLTDAISKRARDLPTLWARQWLPTLVNRELKSVRVVMWIPKDGPVSPAIFCPDATAAAFASLLFSRLFTGLRACLGCGTLFVPDRRMDTDFHDLRCGNLHRKNRQRRREQKGGK